ncbi:MAG: Gfo/Idh/MocA family oxidoreductase [Pseudomonadota bacterium]
MSQGVLIVGLGQIGMGYDLDLDPQQYVYTHARAFSQHPGFHLLAAVDPDAGRRQVFERVFKAPAHATLGAALGQHAPDLVVIATPTAQHRDALQQVLEHSSPAAVLCEKPLSHDVEEGHWMVSACAQKGVKLYVNYMRRSTPGFTRVKRLIDSGTIKTPVKGVVWYSKGLVHNGSHFVNLMEYWLGSVQGASVINSGRLWDGHDPEPDVCIRFEKGEIVFLAGWEDKFSYYALELLSPNGHLRCDQGEAGLVWTNYPKTDMSIDGVSGHTPDEVIDSGMAHYQMHVVNQLALDLSGASGSICTGADAVSTLDSIKLVTGQIEG